MPAKAGIQSIYILLDSGSRAFSPWPNDDLIGFLI
jgi:hypothetical protein